MISQRVDVEEAAVILKLLGDRTRLTMVKILQQHDCCVCEFVAMFQMSQPAISQHLRKLKDLGLVQETRKGQWIMYSLNKENDTYPFLEHILEAIPDQGSKLKQLETQGLRIICE